MTIQSRYGYLRDNIKLIRFLESKKTGGPFVMNNAAKQASVGRNFAGRYRRHCGHEGQCDHRPCDPGGEINARGASLVMLPVSLAPGELPRRENVISAAERYLI
jgi:hypothetical protein